MSHKLDNYYMKKYNITYSDYCKKWKDQGYSCALCERPRKKGQKRFAQDHCHKTGINRGIVCYYCNKYRIARHNLESSKSLYEYMVKYYGK